LLPVGYFHLVFTLPGPIADIAHQNKTAIYGLLFTAAAEATLTGRAEARLWDSPRKSGSHETRRWRKKDSNPRSRLSRAGICRRRFIDIPFDLCAA
jgi:hypothetical protein